MKCDICEGSYLFFQESNLLYCPKCKNKKNPLDIVWKCIICQKEFKAEAKIYNPLEYKSLKICVKEAVVNKVISSLEKNAPKTKEEAFARLEHGIQELKKMNVEVREDIIQTLKNDIIKKFGG